MGLLSLNISEPICRCSAKFDSADTERVNAGKISDNSLIPYIGLRSAAVIFFAGILLASLTLHPGRLEARKSETESKEKDAAKRKSNLDALQKKILYANSTERRNGIAKIKDLNESEKGPFVELLKKLAIEDLDYFVRESSVRTLGEMDRKDAEDVLIKALDDKKSDVQRSAIHSLSEIESKKPLPVFEMIKKQDLSEYSTLNTAAIRLLGDMKYKEASSYFNEKMKDPKINPENKRAILLFYGSSGAVEMKDTLLDTARDEGEQLTMREYAVNSLGRLNDKSAIPELKNIYGSIRSLNSKQERLKFSRLKLQIITALIRLGDDSVVPEIIAAAKDDDSNIRLRAIRQIGEMKLVSAKSLLEFKAEHDESAQVKKAAKESLEIINGKKIKKKIDDELETKQ